MNKSDFVMVGRTTAVLKYVVLPILLGCALLGGMLAIRVYML